MKIPETGQCVIIRSRPGIVRNCISYGEENDRVLHLVDVEYIDGFEHPSIDRVVWEREVGATVFDATDFPDLRNPLSRPDTPSRYHAFVDSMNCARAQIIIESFYMIPCQEDPVLSIN